ncbi:MAG: TrkA family potassium uptake protein [Actinomycetaceae bacterium]|nr:TrkA family potassium uptake protein [Actinomycetaceae bacterium]
MGKFTLIPRIPSSSSNEVVIIGLGRFGTAMGEELVAAGVDVLGIDIDADVVQKMNSRLTQVVRADASNIEVLRQLGVDEFQNAVVAIGENLAASILVASALIKLDGPEIWAKAASEQQAEIFTQLGIKHVFEPEKHMGQRAAHVVTRTLSDYFDLGNGFALAIATMPEKVAGKLVQDTHFRPSFGVTLIGIKMSDGTWAQVTPDTRLYAGQTVLAAGPSNNLEKAFAKHAF